MNRIAKLQVLLLILLTFLVSCEDDIFGPRTFKGTWKATEYDSESHSLTFTVGIDYYPGDSTKITIGNFSNLGINYEVVADISGTDLTIKFQEVGPVNARYRISGTGKASSGLRKIDWSYRVDDDNFTAVFEK